MRIVIVNWAKFADGALNGGGVNGYCRQLALGLVGRGHQVAWLSSGTEYVADATTGGFEPCRVQRGVDEMGIAMYDIINSPVIAPAIFQSGEPLGEVSCPVLERVVRDFFQELKPDIVHFHNIEGFSCGAIDAAKRPGEGWDGARVLFSLHNYHTICHQVYLMQDGRRPCFDYENGHACVGCVRMHSVEEEMRRRAGAIHAAAVGMIPPPPPPTTPTSSPSRAPAATAADHLTDAPEHDSAERSFLTRIVERVRGGIIRRLLSPMPLPVLDSPSTVEATMRGSPDTTANKDDGEASGRALDVVSQKWSEGEFTSAEWMRLSNRCEPEPASSRSPSDYGLRRRAMVDMLSRCDRVLAVSAFVMRKFESMGVDPRVMAKMPIGSKMVELAAAQPELRVGGGGRPRFAEGPVRLAFMGYNNYFKGLHMLLDSLDLLAPEYLARIHLSIWAKDIDSARPRLAEFASRMAGLDIGGAYRYEDVPAMLSGMDAGVVPSVWWDNGPQTVMEYLACGLPVIGAALGGIPDLVRHGENGLLFAGNDRFALAKLLADVVRSPRGGGGFRGGLRIRVFPPRPFGAHAGGKCAM